MSFLFLEIFVFIMFLQPVFLFPMLIPLGALQNCPVIPLAFYIFQTEKSKVRFLKNNYTRYFLLFVSIQIISSSSIWLYAGYKSFLFWLSFVGLYFLIVKLCINEKKVKSIILMIVLGILYLSISSLSTLIKDYYPGIRALGFGWYENPNDLVLILITIIPLVFLLAESTDKPIKRCIFILIAMLFSCNILFSGSREGILGLAVVSIASLFFSKRSSRILKIGLTTALIVSVLTIGMSTILSRQDLSGYLSGDESSENRLQQWKACVLMLKSHPFLGIGPNESRSAMIYYGGVPGLLPHNTILQVFAETGLLGGIFFVLFSCYPIWDVWKFAKNKPNLQDSSITMYKYLMAALLGFWTCAIFSNRVEFSILYILVALIVAVRENIFHEDLVEEKK